MLTWQERPMGKVAWMLVASHTGILLKSWAFYLMALTLLSIGLSIFTSFELGSWSVGVDSLPKWALLGFCVTVEHIYLPVYVAHGFTRRHTLAGLCISVAVSAVISGGIVTVALGVERFAYPLLDLVPISHAAEGAGLGIIWLQASLYFLAYQLSGLLIGAGYYQYGGWKGTLFIVPAILPLVITEILMRPRADGGGLLAGPSVLGSSTFLPLTTLSLVLAIVLAVGVLGVFRVLRDAAIE